MTTITTHTNVSFNFLKGSSDFLNLILNNINSCVLFLNSHMELIAFNDAIKVMFPMSNNCNLKYKRCGEAIGCAHQIEEQKDCGKTSKCRDCELRKSAMDAYLENRTTYKKRILRPFYTEQNIKVNKLLQYTSKLFSFEGDKYILLLIESVPQEDFQIS